MHLYEQNALQLTAYGIDFSRMTDEEKIEQIKTNVLALTDELHEALAEVGWKPWASSRHINTEALRGELIDAYHFMMNLMLIAGMDEDMVSRMYNEKHQRNKDRQAEGYDGIAGKCPVCQRALDDVLEHENPDPRSDTGIAIAAGYCSRTCQTMAARKAVEAETIECGMCHRVRTEVDESYSPMQAILHLPCGWYSGDDGEICGSCMDKTLAGQ